jgi:hypothetical protein
LTAYDDKIYQWLPAGTPELASEHLGKNRVKRSALQYAVSKKYELIVIANDLCFSLSSIFHHLASSQSMIKSGLYKVESDRYRKI